MPAQQPNLVNKLYTKLPLYIQVGFGLIILFGMVGNLAGHREGSVVVFIIATIVWACTRMVYEALIALRVLRFIAAYEEQLKKNDDHKNDPPAGPPPAPVT